MKTCVIDVGGGNRGIYAAGIFDRFIDEGITFDAGIGISAGSANIASYCAGQKGRNYSFYTEYSQRKEYMSLSNLIKDGSYIDMDYLYGTLTNSDGENPLDYEALASNPMDYFIVATNAETGKAKYFSKEDLAQDDYEPLKASCSIPVVCKPCVIDDVPYFDGAASDPVPVQTALNMGYEKIVLILSRPVEQKRVATGDETMAVNILFKYPEAAKAFANRSKKYNEGVALARELEKEGKAIIISPSSIAGMKTLTKNPNQLDILYKRGYEDGEKAIKFMEYPGFAPAPPELEKNEGLFNTEVLTNELFIEARNDSEIEENK